MLQIFQKLQCLTDPSILTMSCKRFIYVLTGNWSNDNPFLVYNRPFQLSKFPATASRVCERDPSALEGGCTRRKLEIATICNGDPKQTFDFFAHCILPTIVNILELPFLVSFYTVKNVSITRCLPRSGYFRIPFGKSVDLRYYFCTYFAKDIDYQVIFFSSMFWWVTIVTLSNSFNMSTDIWSKKKSFKNQN